MTFEWLITGGESQLGRELSRELAIRNISFSAMSRKEFDITNYENCINVITKCNPKIIVNCAAWTQVDLAEDFRYENFLTNAYGAMNLAFAAQESGSNLIQISTDYVFGNELEHPVKIESIRQPLNSYGESKLLGENVVNTILPSTSWILRTSWLYSVNGENFVKAIVSKLQIGSAFEVVDDQFGQPTWARDLANRIIAIPKSGLSPGTYHATNSGSVSWYEFAVKIAEILKFDSGLVIPVKTSTSLRKAKRPINSTLDNGFWDTSKLEALRDWDDGLSEALRVDSWRL